jgi:hypothetical protein
MSSALDSLNLRPQEKRILVVIAVVVFVVLNLVLVVPRFKDYGKIQEQLKAARLNIDKFNKFIYSDTNAGGLKDQLIKLSKQPGGEVSSKEIQLESTVTTEARANGIFVQTAQNVAPQFIGSSGQSDKFFARQSVRINVQATEDALVKFLYDIGNDPAMIRVWELQLNPVDKDRFKLTGFITLTADYQKAVVSNTAPVKPAGLVKPAGPAPKSAPAKTTAPTATPTPAKTTAPTSAPAAQKAGQRAASTDANAAAAKKPSAPPPAPPAFPPAPSRSAAPPAQDRSGGPPVPPRTPRTPVEKKTND